MKYTSERITNISDLERIINICSSLAKILEKEMPDNKKVKVLSETLQTASEFEFCIERRTVRRSLNARTCKQLHPFHGKKEKARLPTKEKA